MRLALLLSGAALLLPLLAQEPSLGNARSMYFAGADVKPVVNKTPKPSSPGRPTSGVAVRRGALGIRYSVMRVVGAGSEEVLPTIHFRSGDRIQLKVEVNDDGYLYIVHHGTTGAWTIMFPKKDSVRGSNKVHPGESYLLPPNASMRFSGPPGTERLFVVLSRKPEARIEDLLYSLDDDREPPKSEGTLLAQNRVVDDRVIGQLRTVARDLVLETVEDNRPQHVERAIYVVNPAAKADSRVVADIQLQHY